MPDFPIATIPVVSHTVPGQVKGVGGKVPTYSRPPLIRVDPIQVVGLVPLHPCGETECRSMPEPDCCPRRLVFGGDGILANSNVAPSYERDFNNFMIDLAIYGANSGATCTIVLQKCSGRATWANVATLNNGTYGVFTPLNVLTNHKTYTGYLVNWSKVLALQGAGIYRIKFSTAMRTKFGCLQSDEFDLRKFNCNIAHGTVKFEAFIKGQIGSATTQGKVFDVCGINTHFISTATKGTATGYYDSVRLPGFFGYEKIKEYLEIILEYQTGLQERIRDEAIQSFTFFSNYFKKELHDRLKIYALMSDRLLVSDYNINNSDYNIRQLPIIKSGAYEPVYLDNKRRRLSKVTVEFKAGVQHIIKSLCCPTTQDGHG